MAVQLLTKKNPDSANLFKLIIIIILIVIKIIIINNNNYNNMPYSTFLLNFYSYALTENLPIMLA